MVFLPSSLPSVLRTKFCEVISANTRESDRHFGKDLLDN